MVICSICNRDNPGNVAFCIYCGSPLAAMPPMVKSVPTPQPYGSVGIPARTVRIGFCYYHPGLPAVYVCNRCGKSICRDCAKSYGGLILCPQCYSYAVPRPVPAYLTFSAYR